MVHYKLTYFNARGIAEPIRYILAQTGVDFEDCRINHDEWAKLKPNTPMGQLPYLMVDNKALGQSLAIARYIAKEHKLAPSDNWHAAKADMLVDGVVDQYSHMRPVVMAMFKGETENAKELWQTYKNDQLANFLGMYDRFLAENGGKFFVGDHITWADLYVVAVLDRIIAMNENDESLLDNFKNLKNLLKHVQALPNIKKYLANRPQTAM